MPDTPRLPMAPAPWWPLVGGSRVCTCRAPRRLLVPSARGQPPPGLVSIPLAPWHRASTWPAPPHQTQRPPGPLWTIAPPEGLLQLTWPARQDYKESRDSHICYEAGQWLSAPVPAEVRPSRVAVASLLHSAGTDSLLHVPGPRGAAVNKTDTSPCPQQASAVVKDTDTRQGE